MSQVLPIAMEAVPAVHRVCFINNNNYYYYKNCTRSTQLKKLANYNSTSGIYGSSCKLLSDVKPLLLSVSFGTCLVRPVAVIVGIAGERCIKRWLVFYTSGHVTIVNECICSVHHM